MVEELVPTRLVSFRWLKKGIDFSFCISSQCIISRAFDICFSCEFSNINHYPKSIKFALIHVGRAINIYVIYTFNILAILFFPLQLSLCSQLPLQSSCQALLFVLLLIFSDRHEYIILFNFRCHMFYSFALSRINELRCQHFKFLYCVCY